MMLADELRYCAKHSPGPFSPHWVDAAKRLMNQAANALDAANVAINEYRLGTASQPNERIK